MRERPSDDPDVVRRTQVIDLARSVPIGVLTPLESAVFLTIAVQQFDAPGWARGLIAAASGVGLLLSTVLTAHARRVRAPSMTVASWAIAAGAVAFVVASSGSLAAYVVGVVVGVAALNMSVPLLTAIYEANFPAAERGRRVGRGMALRVVVSLPLSIVMGAWLTAHLDQWWCVTLLGAVAAGALSVLNRRLPSESLADDDGGRHRLWPRWELLRDDHDLALVLGAWMLMGFGNLMLLPLRIDYLAEEEYGIVASSTAIAMLTVAVPSAVRLLVTPLFGRVFDQMSVYAVRIGTNLLFAAYVVAFFSTQSMTWLVVGSVLFGMATAGGDLMWALWVTKFAPPERTADYMGLHTFLTGVRAVPAPLIAYLVIERISLGWLAVVGTGLIGLSAAVLAPGAWREERARFARFAR